MSRNQRFTHVAAVIASLALAGSVVPAAPIEPTPDPAFRALPADAVRSWHLFNDANANGILDPGDQKVATVVNWWSPVSGHTEANYTPGPYGTNSYVFPNGTDWPSAPMNFASSTDPTANYWLPLAKNALKFYMNFSQFDNNDWQTFTASGDPVVQEVVAGRNMYRNGWSLGYVMHDVTKDSNGAFSGDQTPAGKVAMDLYVHNGEATVHIAGYGDRRSNPQVALSNDISPLALDNTAGPGTGTQYHPPQFDPATGSYSLAANATRLAANGQTPADLATIVGSMELAEKDPPAIAGDAIDPSKTPAQIAATLTDHAGQPYAYQDAFQARHDYVADSTDAGVISGLSGWNEFTGANWGDQQVIRIDLSGDSLASGDAGLYGNLTSVVFYDFGYYPGASQTSPVGVVLDLSDTTLFPEHRFFIAAAEIPEPTTLSLLVGGAALGLLIRRRRRKALAIVC